MQGKSEEVEFNLVINQYDVSPNQVADNQIVIDYDEEVVKLRITGTFEFKDPKPGYFYQVIQHEITLNIPNIQEWEKDEHLQDWEYYPREFPYEFPLKYPTKIHQYIYLYKLYFFY